MTVLGGYSPEAIEKPLHEYQRFAAEWMLRKTFEGDQKGVGLFLDPGLGKTRITLSYLDALFQFGEIQRALIVGPLRPIYTVWPAEMKKWGFPQTNIILHGQYNKALSYGLKIEMVNFAGLKRIKDLSNRWDVVIVDESTFIKNWSAQRSKYLRKIIKTVPKRVILTGTPASNSLADLHSQAFILDDGQALGKTAGVFRHRFCVQGGWQGRKWSVRSGVGSEIKNAIKPLVLSMKAEDHLSMPKLVENDIWCQLPGPAMAQYKKLKRELFAELETGDVYALNQAAAYTKTKQFANGQVYSVGEDGVKESHACHKEKLSALFELHEELAGKPMMILYYYNHDAERIVGAKNSPFRGCPIVRGKQRMKGVKIEDIMAEWNDGKHHALICQIDAVSHGLNMQYGGCADVCYFGIPDSLDKYEQAYRRVYRQGNEEKHVRIHRILVRDTVEEVQLERLAGRHKTQTDFLAALKHHAKG
jgi:hypothetical protein